MPRSGVDTKDRILEAARREIMRRGFAATSIDAIQDAAGISRGTFFYHFPTKDQLARTLLHRYAESDRELVDGLMARAEKLASDPLQQLLIFVSLHEDLFADSDDSDPGCLFGSFSYEAGLFDDETHRAIKGALRHWRAVVSTKLEAAILLHEPRTAVDPTLVADLAYGIFQGAFILSRMESKTSLMIDHIRQLRTHIELLFGVENASELPRNTTQ